MGKTALASALALVLAITMGGCASSGEAPKTIVAGSSVASQEPTPSAVAGQVASQQAEDVEDEKEGASRGEEAAEMRMGIGDTDVSVEWEDNQAVADLHAFATKAPVTVELSMYGGFEQVGPLGTSLTASDEQMTTEPGDIVLYAGNQISVFYGPNSWAYTKLGHVTDRTADEMAELLGNGDTSITIAIR